MFKKLHIIFCLIGILLCFSIISPTSAQEGASGQYGPRVQASGTDSQIPGTDNMFYDPFSTKSLGEQYADMSAGWKGTSSSAEKPNISGLKLMKAVQNEGPKYSGCTFNGSFDENSALGSKNGQSLKAVICWMQDASASLGVGMAVGSTLMKMTTGNFWDAIATWILGLFIFLSFFMLYLIFPLKLLDGFVRLAFIFALMPLWIILWVFPATAGYTKKAFDVFVGSLLYFIALSIMISLALIMMNHALQPDTDEIFKLLLDDNTPEAAALINYTSSFFLTIAFGFMSVSLLGAAEKMSNAFISVPSLHIDNSVVQNMTNLANLTKNIAKTTPAVVKGTYKMAKGTYNMAKKGTNTVKGWLSSSKPASRNQFDGGKGGPVHDNGGPVHDNGGPVHDNGGPVRDNGGPVHDNGGPVRNNDETPTPFDDLTKMDTLRNVLERAETCRNTSDPLLKGLAKETWKQTMNTYGDRLTKDQKKIFEQVLSGKMNRHEALKKLGIPED